MTLRVIGVDEAGRGCVIGPLVICGVSIGEDLLDELVNIGVKDSKRLSKKRREALYNLITSFDVKCEVVKIPPMRIDVYVKRKKRYEKLNKLEAIFMAEVVNRLEGNIVIVDACSTNLLAFYNQIYERLKRDVELIVTHKADNFSPVVSAASIIAKVERDREISKLKERYGDFGSGYPSDKKTIQFLTHCLESGMIPPIVRRSWRTVERLRGLLPQDATH